MEVEGVHGSLMSSSNKAGGQNTEQSKEKAIRRHTQELKQATQAQPQVRNSLFPLRDSTSLCNRLDSCAL